MIFLVFHYEHLVRLGIIFKLKTCFKKTVFNSILILIYKLIKCAHTDSVSVLTAHLLGKEMRLKGLQVVIAQLASGSPRVGAMSESQVLFSIVNRQGTVWLWGFLLASKKIYWWPWINVGLAIINFANCWFTAILIDTNGNMNTHHHVGLLRIKLFRKFVDHKLGLL
jgi:hypothetical protein